MNERTHRYETFCIALLIMAIPTVALLCSLDFRWVAQAQAAPMHEVTLGVSVQGRPITAVRFGDGPRKLVVVGNTHGGPEANTYTLTVQLIEHFRAAPEDVPESVSLYFIPTLNPDGLALNSRFNAAGVDLNRNMNTNLDTCAENNWNTRVQGAYGIVSDTGGAYAESEIESRLIRDFLLDASGAIFLHSNAGLVFPAFCDHEPSIKMGVTYAQSAGYLYNRYWLRYTITGGMHDWAGSLGIASITPELVSPTDSEFEANLAGLQAVLANPEQLLPLPEPRVEAGIEIPALLWRFWKVHGGMERFGPPLTAATNERSIIRQVFERAVLEYRPDQAEMSAPIQLAPLGREVATGRAFAAGAEDGVSRFFPETGHTLREAFQVFWEQNDGEVLFGAPISEEFEEVTIDGQRRIVQYFERAVFAYYPEDGSMRLEPLGWATLLRDGLSSPTLKHQIR